MQYGIFLSVKTLPRCYHFDWPSGDFVVCVCVPCRLAIVPICTHTCIHWLWVSSTATATCCCFFCVSSVLLLCISRYILCPSFSYFNCFCRFVSVISSATLHTFCISVPQNLTHCGKEIERERERESEQEREISSLNFSFQFQFALLESFVLFLCLAHFSFVSHTNLIAVSTKPQL